MSKTFLERLDENREAEARATFANHVQSIAFNLTLSRIMIEALGLLWHFGYQESFARTAEKRKASRYVSGHSVPIFRTLIRRGLVIHVPDPDFSQKEIGVALQHQYLQLTDAGVKVCELLVIAGLLSAKKPEKKKRTA